MGLQPFICIFAFNYIHAIVLHPPSLYYSTSNITNCIRCLQNVRPAQEWCQCNRCDDMPTKTESLCCQMVTSTSDKCHERYNYEDGPWKCITQHPGVDELLKPAPLEVIWNNFQCYHGKLYYFFGLLYNLYSLWLCYNQGILCFGSYGNFEQAGCILAFASKYYQCACV